MTPDLDRETTVPLTVLGEGDVLEVLSDQDALECVENGFRLMAAGDAHNFVRQRDSVGDVTLNVMWSMVPSLDVLGVKSYPVVRSDVSQGVDLVYLLYRYSTGELLRVMKAEGLSQRRTAAASALATRLLARPDGSTLSIFGCGFQAAGHVRAVAAVMPSLRTVLVVGRDESRRASFVDAAKRDLGIEVRAVPPAEAASNGDVIVTATGSAEPVFDGALVRPGTHVNAVGSNSLLRREVDEALLQASATIVVDSRDVALAEGGDLVLNDVDPQQTVEMADVVTGRHPGRGSATDITLFESHGLAVQDVVCAALVHDRLAERQRKGRP